MLRPSLPRQAALLVLALLVALLATTLAAREAAAQTPPPAPPQTTKKLVVGTHPVAPFVIKGDDGYWSGISIDLFRRVAERAGLDYEIREYPVDDLLKPDPGVDVVVSLNATAEAETRMDLTHAFYSTGLAIAVSPTSSGTLATIRKLLRSGLAGVLGVAFGVILVVSALVWLAERKANAAQFGGGVLRGLGNGFWWSAVTMTSVGYGDKAPVTLAGRLLALLWMFAGVFAISIFTGSISSALTVSQLESRVQGPGDLPTVRVGTVEPSGGSRYLKKKGIAYRGFPSAKDALVALERHEVDAVVYEAPILQYFARSDFPRVSVLPGTFDNHGYVFGLRTGSELREPINHALLEIIASDAWPQLLAQYVGPP